MATIIAAHAMLNSKLECSVCYTVFTDPRLLPCGHTYCLQCLQGMLKTAGRQTTKLSCPKCRTEFAVGDQNLQDLPKNFAVVDVISPSADSQCANAGDGDPHGPVQHVCLNCKKVLCDTCSNDHTKTKATNDHTVKLLCEVTPEDIPVHKSTQSVDKYEKHTKQLEEVSHCECCQGHGSNNILYTTANVEQPDDCQRLALDTAATHHQEDQAAPKTTPVRSVTTSNGASTFWRSASSRAFTYSRSASTSDKQSLLARSHSVRASHVDTAEQDASSSSRLFSVFGTLARARVKSSTVAAVEEAKLLSEEFFIDSRIWTYVKSWKQNELVQITKVISITEKPQAAATGDLVLDVVPLATGRTGLNNIKRHMDMLQDIFIDADNKLNVFPLDILTKIRDPEAQFIVNVLMNDVKAMKLIDNSLVGEKAAVKQAKDSLHLLLVALTRAGSVKTVQALSILTEVVIIRTSSPLLPLVLLQPGHLYTETRGGQLRAQFINADITQQQVKAIVDPMDIELSRNGVLSGVIAQAAGDDYVKQCQLSAKKDGVLSPLSCRTTSGGKLHAAYVIHAAGLNATTYKSDAEVLDKMTTVFWNVFAEAERRRIDSIAIPAIGAGTKGVPLSIVVQAAISALLQHISTPASRNSSLRDIRFVDITKWKVDKFQKVLLAQVCLSVAVTTGGRSTSPTDDIRSTHSGPPAAAAAAADLGAIGTIKSKLKSLFSSARSNSSSSKDMQVPGASSSSSSSSLSSSLSGAAAASSSHGQDYVDGQGVQTTAHDNPRSSQGSTSHTYNVNVPLQCAGCGKISTSVKKQ